MFPQEQPSRFELDVQTVTRYFPGKFYKLGPANRDHVNVFYSSHGGEAPSGDATLQILMHDLDARTMAPFCNADLLTARMFPQEQPSRFELDVQTVTRYFPGKFYKLGPANRDHINVFYSSHGGEAPSGDATLQILMHDLDARTMAPFCSGDRFTARQVEQRTGLDNLYPRPMVTDGFLFTPCGYSVNGVHGADYYTIHVTPQDQGSYVSFETNIFEPDYSDTLGRVISTFRPGRFSVVLTTSMDEECPPAHDTLEKKVSGYQMTDKSWYEFDCGYSVSFLNYEIMLEERN